MSRSTRRRRLELALAATVSIAAGCAPTEAAPANPVHLIADQTDVTMGAETRPAAAPQAVKLMRREFESRDEIPVSIELPAGAPVGARLLIHYRSLGGRKGSPRASGGPDESRVVRTVSKPDGIHIPLPGLADYARSTPVELRVTSLPAGGTRPFTHRAHVAVPPGGRLRFGYGIRSESWVPDAPAARFLVVMRQGERTRRLFNAVIDPGDSTSRRWHDGDLDLSEFSGREIVLDFTTRVDGNHAGLTLPVFSDPVLYADDGGASPNVIVVSLDTLRARSLGAYGYPRNTSPFFDATAADGTLFENAITTSVTTGPSHMSLFTGLYPVNHGVERGLQRKLSHVPTLAGQFRDAGYATAAFAENGYLVREHGFGEGFDAYTDNKGERLRAPGKVRETFGQARRWLEAGPRRPFFLFVHTYEVHTPHDPPHEYANLFSDDEHPGPEDPRFRRVRDHYDREIRYVDDELSGLFETIQQQGLAASTLVVLLADHGEEFWEHGFYQHGGAVYEESIRIPLVFWGPGRIPAGRRIGEQASLIDVSPTLLELAGIEAPEGLDGQSLVPAIVRGEASDPRTLFAEARAGRRWVSVLRAKSWNPPLIAVRSADRKFIVHRPENGDAQPVLLFDLESDPSESSPLEISPEVEREVKARVSDYLAGRIGDGSSETEAPAIEPEDSELTDRLRQLGYVE